MIIVRPRDIEEFRSVVSEAKNSGKLVYISAHPCPECKAFELALRALGVDTSRIVKIDVPSEDWAVEYVVEELGVAGAPSVLLPDGGVLDDVDPLELARKVKRYLEKNTV